MVQGSVMSCRARVVDVSLDRECGFEVTRRLLCCGGGETEKAKGSEGGSREI